MDIRNDNKAVFIGIVRRHRTAYQGQKWWKLRLLTNWKFVFSVVYLSVALVLIGKTASAKCSTIDPAGCRVHSEQALVPIRLTSAQEFEASVFLGTATVCGVPDICGKTAR